MAVRHRRVLSVYLPSGTFTTVVRITGMGDEPSKQIAIEVFRKARPRLG